jgi:carboxymethylenebutenolidase
MKRVLCLVVALAFPLAAHAQEDWAKPVLEKSPRHREYVTVKNGDREVVCFIVYPEVKEKATAVIVIHEIFGLSDWPKLLADELAEAGYIAIAPDLLSAMAPGGGGTDKFPRDGVMKAIRTLPPDQVTSDLNAVAKYVGALPACNGKIAVCGFCWGGGQCFRFATKNPDLKAAFVFYGASELSDADIARIACPVYGFYGENDARINATIPKSTDMMKSAGKTYDPITYAGGGHGFMRGGEPSNPNARPGDVKAREEAWARWKELLRKL